MYEVLRIYIVLSCVADTSSIKPETKKHIAQRKKDTTNHEVPGSSPGSTMGIFFLQGKVPVVNMVWVVSRFRLKAPPGISSSCISPLTSSGQRSRASWASQPQKSATLSPQPEGKPRKFIRTCGGIGKKITIIELKLIIHSQPDAGYFRGPKHTAVLTFKNKVA